MELQNADLHLHILARMRQRGISREEVERTLREGWPATDTKEGTCGRVMVFAYNMEWEGRFYQEKEVTVYYKLTVTGLVLLTAKARYGRSFPRKR